MHFFGSTDPVAIFDHMIKFHFNIPAVAAQFPLLHFAFSYLFGHLVPRCNSDWTLTFSSSFSSLKFLFCFDFNSLSILSGDIRFFSAAIIGSDWTPLHVNSVRVTFRAEWLQWVGLPLRSPHPRHQTIRPAWVALARHPSVMQNLLLGRGSIQLPLQYRLQCCPPKGS